VVTDSVLGVIELIKPSLVRECRLLQCRISGTRCRPV
jgi:hypothetical protein